MSPPKTMLHTMHRSADIPLCGCGLKTMLQQDNQLIGKSNQLIILPTLRDYYLQWKTKYKKGPGATKSAMPCGGVRLPMMPAIPTVLILKCYIVVICFRHSFCIPVCSFQTMSRGLFVYESREEPQLWLHQFWQLWMGFPHSLSPHDPRLLGESLHAGKAVFS